MALSKIPTDLVSGSLASSQLPAQLSISSSASSGSLAVDSAGRVTMPYQPSFWTSTSGCTRNGTTGVVENFPTPFFNTGSNFNTSNGRFTAPVTGLYAFWAAKYNAVTANGVLTLHVNGAQRSYNDFNNNSTIGTHPNVTLYFRLNAGDYVDMRITSGFAASDANDYFGGYLIG